MLYRANPYAVYFNRFFLMSSLLKCLPWKIRRRVRGFTEYGHMLYMTLCYNYFTTIYLAFETALEPMFWFVDRFARYLGIVSLQSI